MTPEETHDDQSTADAAPGYVRADAPIESRADDRLQRVSLAEAIADQVVHGPPGQGLVIGVEGKWGSGKTSVLRMVEEAVRERGHTIILRFNPWLFSGTDQLVSRFLDELAAQLRKESGREGGNPVLARTADQLSAYAETLTPLAWLPVLGPWLARLGSLGRVTKALKEAQSQKASAEELRELVGKELLALNQRVLVVVDDLDRIEPDQIRDMLRLIKLVGDFPNVTYLITYDRKPIERALGDDAEHGAAYLEKIVQVVHSLPEPPADAIERIFLGELQEIVDALPTGPFRQQDWQNILPAGMRPFFRTLRDVRRYLNAVPVSLRVIGEEVALVDVLALEALRVFAPGAYEEVSLAVEALTREGRDPLFGSPNPTLDEADRQQLDRILEAAGEHGQPAKEILRRLFPGAGHLLGGTPLVGGEAEARQHLRVAHPDVLRTYLRRALLPGVISGPLVRAAVEAMSHPDRFAELFDGLDPQTAEGLIQRLEDFEHEYDSSAVEPALPVLLNQLPRLREGRLGLGSAELTVGRVVLRLLRSVDDESETLVIVERVLSRIHHLSGRMELIDTVGHRENVGHELISEEDSARLYGQLRGEVMTATPEQLARERGLVHLFVRVRDDDAGAAWIRQVSENDAVLLRLLRAGLGEQTSQTLGDYAVQSRPSLPWELYQEWIEESELKRRIDELSRVVDREAADERDLAALEAATKYASGELSNERFPGGSSEG